MKRILLAAVFVCCQAAASDDVVVIEKQGGAVAILYPNLKSGLTLDQIIAKDVPVNARYKVIKANTLPSSRSKRDEWAYDEGKSNAIDSKGALSPRAGVK